MSRGSVLEGREVEAAAGAGDFLHFLNILAQRRPFYHSGTKPLPLLSMEKMQIFVEF